MRLSPIHLILLLAALALLALIIQLQILTIAFERLGISPGSAGLLVLGFLLGSAINIPLFRIRALPSPTLHTRTYLGMLRVAPSPFQGTTLIAVNVGGCLMPLAVSVYLMANSALPAGIAVLGILIMSGASYALSQPVPGMGIAMPMFVPPIIAALIGLVLGADHAPQLAYVSGTVGVIIGADLLRFREIGRLGATMASIGGAGTFDGIFLTGIFAALLA